MIIRLRILFVCLLVIQSDLFSEKVYEVVLNKDSVSSYALTVSFQKAPSAEIINRILKREIESAAILDGSKDISVFAFQGETALIDDQYCGGYVYSSGTKSIKTFAESRGLKTETRKEANYSVDVKEDKTFEGIVPERRWLNVVVTFGVQPTTDEAFKVLKGEMEKVVTRGMDVDGSVMIGSNSSSPKTMKDPSGGFVMMEYEKATTQFKKK
jgi:hypothetical protein